MALFLTTFSKKYLYGSTIASDLVCLAGLVSELNAVPGSLDDLPSGRPGKAPEMGGESGSTTVIYAVLLTLGCEGCCE